MTTASDGVDLESLRRDYEAALLTTPGPPIVLVMAYVNALEQQLSDANAFEGQVIEALIVDCIFEKAHETDARKAVHDLCAWEAKMALDPAISSDAAALRDTYLEQLSAARRESAWQPIATAPKDGTVILLYRYRLGSFSWIICYWDKAGWCVYENPDKHVFDATHWMPLPQRPATSGEGAGE